jgi:glycosyltransferase involved in cell wall biosynthesis
MNARSPRITIIVPTKNRADALFKLLDSIRRLCEVDTLRPEVIVANNGSEDDTLQSVEAATPSFPTSLRVITVTRPGKSAAINEALKEASGDVMAFLDDDVTVEKSWLTAVNDFFRAGEYEVGQGIIRLPAPEKDEPEIVKLIERYRTIPRLEYKRNFKTIRSLNGANFFARREVFDRVGGFDERLGPGASGTSEDVDFARRLGKANIAIGYVPQVIVYHRIDRSRLTEEYFKQSHLRQGGSRFLIRKRARAVILLNLLRAGVRYAYHSARGNERDRYRNKGRIYHYLGMMEAKKNHMGDKRP